MVSYKTIFDGRAIHTPLIHQSNNIYIFTWLKHLKLVKAYKLKSVKICCQLKTLLKLWLSNQILVQGIFKTR